MEAIIYCSVLQIIYKCAAHLRLLLSAGISIFSHGIESVLWTIIKLSKSLLLPEGQNIAKLSTWLKLDTWCTITLIQAKLCSNLLPGQQGGFPVQPQC